MYKAAINLHVYVFVWTQAFFSLDSSTVPVSLDTCYVQEGIPQLTQPSEEERRNRVTVLVPPGPSSHVCPQRCPVMWALVLGAMGEEARGGERPPVLNFKCAGKPRPLYLLLSHPETRGPRSLFSSHSCSPRPHDYPQPPGYHGPSQGRRGGHSPTTPLTSSPLFCCCSPLVSPWPRTMSSRAISTPALG